MIRHRRVGAFASVALLALCATPVAAVEYRLRVANVRDEAFTSFLKPGEIHDGATGSGLERLEASLDTGDFPKAVLLYDRHLQAAPESTARAYGGVPVRVDAKAGGEGKQLWDEARWEGTPGEQSVWVVASEPRRPGDLYRVAIGGRGPFRHFLPYGTTNGSYRLPVVKFPLNYLFFHREEPDFWVKQIAPVLDLTEGIGVIAAARDGVIDADQAYIIVTHGTEPATYKAVFGWRERYYDRETPGRRFPRIKVR